MTESKCYMCNSNDVGWITCKGKEICIECRDLIFNNGQDDIFYMGSTYQKMLSDWHLGLALVQMYKGINIFNPFKKYHPQEFFIQKCPGCKNHFAFQVQYCYLCGTKVGITCLENEVRIELEVLRAVPA